MPSRLAPNQAKAFDARTASIVVRGNPVSEIESFGYDQSKDHELQYTLDQKAIWVKTTPELTGTFVLKATSNDIDRVEQAFLQDATFDITAQLARTAGQQQTINFTGCMLTDFSMSDYEVGGIPTVTGEWQGVNRGAGESRSQGNAPAGQEQVLG